ncbi:MAG: AAA family ATPase [Muribaculaceae bacterium]|nr:AAA family ATPase [Muribaculaceae bacterium]
MATSKQKNTISNVFRYRSLEEENENPALYRKNEGGNIFNSKCLHTMVNETQPTIDLWHGLWHQGEMACLFGEPNVGKTILAMKIAADIVRRGESVLYFDFENAEHQLIPRYQGKEIPFIDILTFNYKNHYLKTDNHSLLDYIKRAALLRETHIIIIDDITHLFGIGNPADVRHVLNTLRSWTKHLRMSILVLAHSVKKRMNQIATIEQLAGSFECALSLPEKS